MDINTITTSKTNIDYSGVIAYDVTGMAGFIYYKPEDTVAIVVKSFYQSHLKVEEFVNALSGYKLNILHIYSPSPKNLFKEFIPKEIRIKRVNQDIDIEAMNALFKFYADNGCIRFESPPKWRFDVKDQNCQAAACAALAEAIKTVYWLKYGA